MRAQSSVWMDIADDDLEAAEHCFIGKRFLWSMFMCRYPDKRAVLEAKCSQDHTKEILERSKGAVKWLTGTPPDPTLAFSGTV